MTAPSGHFDQVETALADYLTRLEAGEAPDPEEYARRYPQCADELRKFFDDMRFVDTKLAEEKEALRQAVSSRLGRPDLSPLAEGEGTRDGPRLPRIGGFRLLHELGRGSQGVVYEAEQLSTKRTVALKVIREGAFASEGELRRFENEVELASRLTHGSIVRIYESGYDAGRHYFAMEHVAGEPLDVYMAGNMLPDAEALRLFLEICDGVSYAHQHGVIHRDLKPSNVIVDAEGHAHILDFGLAKPVPGAPGSSARDLTEVGEFAGTWHYASPEQVKRDPALLDVRSDVYALGVILYELVTDTYPYPIQSESRDMIAKHILESPPSRPSSIRKDLDDDLETIILRALHKDPDRRYQSAAAFGEDIRRYLDGLPIEAKRDSAWYVISMTLRRHRWRVAAAATSLVALVVFAVTVSILYSQAVRARTEAEIAQATTQVRADMVRASQTYVNDKLDELHLKDGVLGRIIETYPDLPPLGRLTQKVNEDPSSLFAPVVAGMPDDIFDAVRAGDGEGYEAAVEWLSLREAELADIEAISHTVRFVFGVERRSASGFMAADTPGHMGHATRLCEAFAARALWKSRLLDAEAAVTSLGAARSVALDMGDGRLSHHKTRSVSMRSRTYDAVLVIFGDAVPEGREVSPYVNWVLSDPPLASYRLAMISTRQKRSQLFEALFVGGKPGEPGYLDLDALDAYLGGLYSRTGGLTPGTRALARSITPDDALNAIGLYFDAVEHWDSLSLRDLGESARQRDAALEENRAWSIVHPLLPQLDAGFKFRARTNAKRSATRLAMHLCRYRQREGVWPQTLVDAASGHGSARLIDPSVDRPFGYVLSGGGPLLYSLNEDGRDDGGAFGNWGEPQTDVQLFPLPE
jgi:tRNA A-37 threonylcarbamoyl transferase component Bud32